MHLQYLANVTAPMLISRLIPHKNSATRHAASLIDPINLTMILLHYLNLSIHRCSTLSFNMSRARNFSCYLRILQYGSRTEHPQLHGKFWPLTALTGVGILCVHPKFQPTWKGWNLALSQKSPTLVCGTLSPAVRDILVEE